MSRVHTALIATIGAFALSACACLEGMGRPFTGSASAAPASGEMTLETAMSDPSARSCGVYESRNWTASLTEGDNPEIRVSGVVDVRTGGYSLSWRQGPVDSSARPALRLELVAIPPEGMSLQAITTHEVEWREATGGIPFARVLVSCGGETLADIRLDPVPTADLAGTEWKVTSMGGAAIVAGSEPTIAFDSDGRMSGTTGCNRFFGSYQAMGETIIFSGAGMTRMACMQEGLMAQESAFAAILNGEGTFTRNADGTLTVRGANGIAFTAEPQHTAAEPGDPAVLTGGEWRVEDIGRGGVIDRSNLTLAFSEEGRISGSTGCNRMMGGYSVDGGKISFTPIATTLMACTSEAMAEQEIRYTGALSGEMDWRIMPDGALELTGPEGARILLRRDS